MTNDQRVRLWDAINRYVVACGGDPSQHVYGNVLRMDSVADVEKVIREVIMTCLTSLPRKSSSKTWGVPSE